MISKERVNKVLGPDVIGTYLLGSDIPVRVIDRGVHWHFTLIPFKDYGRWKWLFYRAHHIDIEYETPNVALRGAEPALSAERPLEGTVIREG